MGELRHVEFGQHREHKHEHNHTHTAAPNTELVNYINDVARQLQDYNERVAKITHQEHLLKH